MLTLALAGFLSAAPAPALTFKQRPYDAQHYKLELRLGDEGAFDTVLTATLKATRGLGDIELDAYDLDIKQVTVDGAPAKFKTRYDAATRTGALTVTPAKAVPAGKDAQVVITFSGKPTTAAEGFLAAREETPEALPVYYTHFEPNGAQRFFPCNDQPADKATSEVLAVVPEQYTVLSNGKQLKNEAFTEGGKNLRRVHWKQEKPHSTYLVALAIGRFEGTEASPDIPATLWTAPGKAAGSFPVANNLRPMFNFQLALLGVKYPWAKLDVVAIPRYYFGGMENTSLIFNRESATLQDKNDQVSPPAIVSLLGHEMAHQFFGDLVTPRWWNEVWLAESFASWLGALTLEDYNGSDNDMVKVANTASLLDWYFPMEAGPRAMPLVPRGDAVPEDLFNAVTYTKGAQVLRMLDLWLGRAEFKAALKLYLDTHAFQAVTSDDFFKAVADTSTLTVKSKEPLTLRGGPTNVKLTVKNGDVLGLAPGAYTVQATEDDPAFKFTVARGARATVDLTEAKPRSASAPKGKELKGFQESWLTKRGYPVLTTDFSYAAGSLAITIRQQPNRADEKGPFVFKLPIVVRRNNEPQYSREAVILVDKPEVKLTLDVPAPPQWINWNRDGTALVAFNTAAIPEEQWVDAARYDADSTWRLLATRVLLGEIIKPEIQEETKPTDSALLAVLDVLAKDPSPYLRAHILQKLAQTRFKKLPREFTRLLLEQSKKPEGLSDDPIGFIKVRQAAMEALGRAESNEAQKYLLDELNKRQLDINYVDGYAAGAARLGNTAAVAVLKAALVNQKPQGPTFYRRVASKLGLVDNVEVVPVIRQVMKDNAGNVELLRAVLSPMRFNRSLRSKPEAVELLRDAALDATLHDELRASVLQLLEDVKTDEVKVAVAAVAEKADSPRLQGLARKILEVNFPAPAKGAAPKKK